MSKKNKNQYKCDCCGEKTDSRYDIDIQVDFHDTETFEEDGWREYPYRLCSHCYYKWYEGKMSTIKLIKRCNQNIEKEKNEKDNCRE